MEKTLSEEEKQRINALLEKHRPREEIQEKEMVVFSVKGREISIKTEAASSSMKPFEERPVEHEEEASKRKYEVIGTGIETEYEDMDTEDEEHKVRKLTKEELEMYHQYKEFYTIQARTKGKMPGFGYIHRLNVKERYPGVPTDLAEILSHPIEGEVQDIDHMTEQEPPCGGERSMYSLVAQLVEHLKLNQEVPGSFPGWGIMIFFSSQGNQTVQSHLLSLRQSFTRTRNY